MTACFLSPSIMPSIASNGFGCCCPSFFSSTSLFLRYVPAFRACANSLLRASNLAGGMQLPFARKMPDLAMARCSRSTAREHGLGGEERSWMA